MGNLSRHQKRPQHHYYTTPYLMLASFVILHISLLVVLFQVSFDIELVLCLIYCGSTGEARDVT